MLPIKYSSYLENVLANFYIKIFGIPYFTKQIEVRILNRGVNSHGAGRRMLDIGCGDGITLLSISKASEAVVGVDIDINNLIIARELFANSVAQPRANFVVSDVSRGLCFNDDTFDRVVSLSVYEHIENDTIAFKEAWRCMTHDGLFFLIVPSSMIEQGRIRFLQAAVKLSKLPFVPNIWTLSVFHAKSLAGAVELLAVKYAHARVGYSIADLSGVATKIGWQVVGVQRTVGYWGQVATDLYNSLNCLQVRSADNTYTAKNIYLYGIWFMVARLFDLIDQRSPHDVDHSGGWMVVYKKQ